MERRHNPEREPARDNIDTALGAMSADELREVVREMLPELDEKTYGRVMNSLLHRAARGGSGWAPAALSGADVEEVRAFAKAAQRAGHADPSEVDEYLRRGTSAFLRKDYHATHQVFGALLRPIGEGEIDLGQDEMVDEVLGADPSECAAQYVVAAYMLSSPTERAETVHRAIAEVQGVGNFWEPILEMERVATESLPGLDTFLPAWRDLMVRKAADTRKNDWDTEADRWLREVVQRLEGSDGLAKIARSTRRADDLRAWCRSSVDARDWRSALSAFEDAAGLVGDKEHEQGEYLDGAALAAQESGREDLPVRIARAWRASPTMPRLRRWLGAANGSGKIRKIATEALEACPPQAAGQRAFLQVLLGNYEAAAKLLAAAPGLGWSAAEHPGHLLFPLFADRLGGKQKPPLLSAVLQAYRGVDIEELGQRSGKGDAPRLATPELDELLRLAGVDDLPSGAARTAVIAAMREAAEHRLIGVTDQKRRRHYGHAAALVAVCVACDPSSEMVRWAASIRAQHRRFPALCAELDRALGTVRT